MRENIGDIFLGLAVICGIGVFLSLLGFAYYEIVNDEVALTWAGNSPVSLWVKTVLGAAIATPFLGLISAFFYPASEDDLNRKLRREPRFTDMYPNFGHPKSITWEELINQEQEDE